MADRMRQANVEGGRRIRREVKLTDLEDNALLLAAGEAGLTVQRLMVESALAFDRGESVTERREMITLLHRMHGQLAAIGNNLNQTAKAANATGEIASDISQAIAYLRGTISTVSDAAERLGQQTQKHAKRVSGDGA